MALQAVIFDMDGTLVDSMPYHEQSWYLFLKKHGIQVTPEEFIEKNHGTLYDNIPRFFERVLTKEEIYSLGMEKEALFRTLYLPHLALIPGALGLLQSLNSHGIRIALGTAADDTNVDFTLNNLDIRHFFDAITTSDEIPLGKPNPAVYVHTAAKMGILPENCLVFEDSITGIQAGLAAGMKVAAITTMITASKAKEQAVCLVIPDFTEVSVDLLQSLF